ncbi:MAG: phage holin family protein [Rhodobacteraceae bacterium]|nr:phage holin family protein [Paracoccaceae bacterium]
MIRDRIARAARRSALGLAGGLFLAAGIATLTVAAWILMAEATDHFTAALTIGLIYSGLGLILIAVAGRSTDERRHHPTEADTPPPKGPPPDLVNAFFEGLGAGVAARKGYDRGRGKPRS